MKPSEGFTLIELLMIVIIIGILATLGVARYKNLLIKSKESQTKGNLATLRSAIAIYYGDNEQSYPWDDLSSLRIEQKYLADPAPLVRTPPYHPDSEQVTAETNLTETGTWSYNNDATSFTWGSIHVGCSHQDSHGSVWSSY